MTPLWRAGPEGAYLELKGMDRVHGPGADGAAAVCARARRVFPVWSAGLASSVLASRLASLVAGRRGRNCVFTVPPGSVSSFLSGFPVQVLDRYFREVTKLALLGVHTLGDLQAIPDTLLTAVFGPAGLSMNREALGVGGNTLQPVNAQLSRDRVARVFFSRPLASETGERALRRALAVRAMAWSPASGRATGRWSLWARWSSGTRTTVSAKAPERKSWFAWLSLLDVLWQKLPTHRQGLRELELSFQSGEVEAQQQLDLFAEPGDAEDLALAIARIRRESDSSFTSASEVLLQGWGARWGFSGEEK